MFGFGKSKKNYEKICKDPEAVFRLLYDNRAKTSGILGDDGFISAWLDGEKQQEITLIIRKEAIGGDVPSLKQMVWFLGVMHEDLSSAPIEKKQKLEAIVGILEERIDYCNKLISIGIPQQYYAMVSSHNLYKALHELNKPGTLVKIRNTLNEMVEHAQAVIKMGKNHPAFDGDAGIISDAEIIQREGEGLRKLLNAMGDSVSTLGKG